MIAAMAWTVYEQMMAHIGLKSWEATWQENFDKNRKACLKRCRKSQKTEVYKMTNMNCSVNNMEDAVRLVKGDVKEK